MSLKPCPFCGNTYVFVRTTHRQDGLNNTQYEVYCSNCSAVGGSRLNEATAIAHWNQRAKIKEPRCRKCVYEMSCSCNRDYENQCPDYKRDAPDGGYYG